MITCVILRFYRAAFCNKKNDKDKKLRDFEEKYQFGRLFPKDDFCLNRNLPDRYFQMKKN
jgi:hypothetical protein